MTTTLGMRRNWGRAQDSPRLRPMILVFFSQRLGIVFVICRGLSLGGWNQRRPPRAERVRRCGPNGARQQPARPQEQYLVAHDVSERVAECSRGLAKGQYCALPSVPPQLGVWQKEERGRRKDAAGTARQRARKKEAAGARPTEQVRDGKVKTI